VSSRREAILEATAAIIAEGGLAGLSMTAVARRAGVAPALLYYHFGDRGALIRGALHHAADRGPSMGLLKARDRQTGLDAMRAALLAEFDDDPSVRNLNVIWNDVGALAAIDGSVREDLAEVTAAWDEAVAVGILRGMADGSIRPGLDPVAVAGVLTALVEGLSQQWLARTITVDKARAMLDDALARMLVNSPDITIDSVRKS
jgi:AcrR family transcriptional regulator